MPSFDWVYRDNTMPTYIQEITGCGLAKVVMEEGAIIPVYESMRITACRCIEEYFELAIYDVAVEEYKVSKVHVLIVVEVLIRSSKKK